MYDLCNDAYYSTNRDNWASKVKTLLHTIGFTYVWLNQGVENVTVFKKKVFAQRNRGYLFFSVKDRNLFHRENITDGVHEMK